MGILFVILSICIVVTRIIIHSTSVRQMNFFFFNKSIIKFFNASKYLFNRDRYSFDKYEHVVNSKKSSLKSNKIVISLARATYPIFRWFSRTSAKKLTFSY